jgi:hypothetical protein
MRFHVACPFFDCPGRMLVPLAFIAVFNKDSIEIRTVSCYSDHIKKSITNGQNNPVYRQSRCKQPQQFGPVIAALIAF